MAATAREIAFIPKSLNGRSVEYNGTASGFTYSLKVNHKDQGQKILTTMTLKTNPNPDPVSSALSTDILPATLTISFTRDKNLSVAEAKALFEILSPTPITGGEFDDFIAGALVTGEFISSHTADYREWVPADA